MNQQPLPKKYVLIAVRLIVLIVTLGAFALLYPIVQKNIEVRRAWDQLLSQTDSPFSCGRCGYRFTDKDVKGIHGGMLKGACPKCGVQLVDSLAFKDSSGASGNEILAYQQTLIDRWRQRHGAFNPTAFFLVIVIVGFPLGYKFFMKWFSNR